MWNIVFQIQVQASDKGIPANRTSLANGFVTVNVLRNTNPPIFFSTAYETTIAETAAVGFSVLTVQASDSDTDVSESRQAVYMSIITVLSPLIHIFLYIT